MYTMKGIERRPKTSAVNDIEVLCVYTEHAVVQTAEDSNARQMKRRDENECTMTTVRKQVDGGAWGIFAVSGLQWEEDYRVLSGSQGIAVNCTPDLDVARLGRAPVTDVESGRPES